MREPVCRYPRAGHLQRLRVLHGRDGHDPRGRGGLLRRLRRQPVEDRRACQDSGRSRRHHPSNPAVRAHPDRQGHGGRLWRLRPHDGSADERDRGVISIARSGGAHGPEPDGPARARQLPARRHAGRRWGRLAPRDGQGHRLPHQDERPRRRVLDAPLRGGPRPRDGRDAHAPDERLEQQLRRVQRVRGPHELHRDARRADD